MKTEPKRCTARGKLVKDTHTGAPTAEKLKSEEAAREARLMEGVCG